MRTPSPSTVKRAAIPALAASVVVLVLAVILAQSYMGRVTIIDSARSGCERSKIDRAANAAGWRSAQTARQAAALAGGPNAATDRTTAYRYARIATSLESRTGTRLDCRQVYPDPSPLP